MNMEEQTPVAHIEENMTPSAPPLGSTEGLQVPESWAGPTAAAEPKPRQKRSASIGQKFAKALSTFSCGGAVAGGSLAALPKGDAAMITVRDLMGFETTTVVNPEYPMLMIVIAVAILLCYCDACMVRQRPAREDRGPEE